MRLPRLLAAAAVVASCVFAWSCEPAAVPVAAAPVAPPAAPPPAPQDPLDAPLPLDARIHQGTLPNGLTYYVLVHHKPEHRAQIWLAVNAGSVLEDDDQRGLAHFVEHMGFNGTKRFPKQAIVDFLERSGVRFGADLNAYTSFDETVYTLQVPTDNAELFDKAIGIVRDWSDSVTFDPVEVDKERGVVLEEWRLGRGAGARIRDKQAPVLFHGSKYADRLTIGKPEIIKGASRDTLYRFYKDWYRPDLMAVIAVGDFDGAAMEAKIKAEFASVKPATTPRPREVVPLPPHAEELVSIETDPEATATSVWAVTKRPPRPTVSTRDYRRFLVETLYTQMVNARFDELRRQPDAPFLSASASTGPLVRSADSFSERAVVKETGVVTGWSALLREILRVERHGFVAAELTRAKTERLRTFERAVLQRQTEESRGFASEIVRNFLIREAMPGEETELKLAQDLLPGITLEEANQLGKTLDAGSRVIVVSGPTTMSPVTEASLKAAAQAVLASDIPAYDDGASNASLMASTPTPGSVVTTRAAPELGVTEWTLANGVRVVVKPTDFKADEVRLTAFAPGGTSLAPDADYESAKYAGVVTGQGGLGTFDAAALRKMLSGKIAGVSASIGELDEQVSGAASPTDLVSLFQLVHLSFTAPRKDENAFASWRARELEGAKNRRLSPELAFREDLGVFFSQNHRRRQPVTPEVIEKVDLDKALGFYKSRFADASGFTFVIVGNLDLAKTKTLAETYLGSLPATHKKEKWQDVHVTHPRGVAKKSVTQGSEPKSQVWLAFHGSDTWSRDGENDLRLLAEVLGIRLREVLREDMGGVYGVSVSGGIERRPVERSTFTVSFGCAPENVEKLEQAVWDEIKAVQAKGIGDDYITKVKAIRRRAHETNLRQNGYWLRELERAYTYGDDPKLILDAMVDKVSSDRAQKAAKKYLTRTQYALGELRPASVKGTATKP